MEAYISCCPNLFPRQAVHVRGASVLALALSRFRVLNTVLLTHVPPLLLEIVR